MRQQVLPMPRMAQEEWPVVTTEKMSGVSRGQQRATLIQHAAAPLAVGSYLATGTYR